MIANRRHHAERLKTARKSNTHCNGTPKDVGKALHTPARCSCPTCGNPRKWFKQSTIQEQRFMQEIE